jgi:serine/threonine-protein kinase
MTDRIDSAGWRRAHDIVDAVIDLSGDERAAAIRAACHGDASLESAVRRWLLACDDPPSFLDHPPNAGPAAIPHAIPERIGPYRIVRIAGQGGMGTVYEAERADGEFTRRVALKILRDVTGDPDGLARRFRAERQILASLDHPNIARLLDGGVTAGGLPFYVMEFVEGQPIDHHADEHHLGVPERLALFRQICAAVRYAHQRLVVHRDLKPANVLVTAGGQVKLLDFGIARVTGPEPGLPAPLTRTVSHAMTPEYASPEQFRGDAITVTSDVYSLGVVLFELLTGRRPFNAAGIPWSEFERTVLTGDPPRPSDITNDARIRRQLRGDLDTIVLTAMRADPVRRYGSAEQLDGDIERHLSGLPVSARPDTVGYRSWKFVRRHHWQVAAAILVMLSVIGTTVVTAVQSRRMAAAAAQADAERDNAENLSDFLLGLLQLPYPYDSGGVGSLKGMLDNATVRLDSALSGSDDSKTEVMESIAYGYLGMAEYASAERLLERVLAIKRAGGAPELEIADVRLQLAEVLRVGGDPRRALREYDRALPVLRREFGERHIRVLIFTAAAGRANRVVGELDRAEALLRATIAIYRETPIPTIGLANALTGLADVLRDRGDWPGAERAYREVLAMRRAIGAAEAEVAVTLTSIAALRSRQGALAEADSLYAEAIPVLVSQLGPDHIDAAYAFAGLGSLRTMQRRFTAADSILDRTLARARAALPPDHPGLVEFLEPRARLDQHRGSRDSADAFLREASRILAAVETRASPRRALIVGELGRMAVADGRETEGLRLLEQSLEMLDAAGAAGHPDAAAIRRRRAGLHGHQPAD